MNVTKEDSVRFYINDELKGEVFLANEELNKKMSTPIITKLCEKNVKIYDLNMLYVNQKTNKYSPIEMKISSNINTLSDAYWAISNLKYFKQECSPKCPTCDNNACLSCGNKMIFKSGECLCNAEIEQFDFNDEEERILCQGKIIK